MHQELSQPTLTAPTLPERTEQLRQLTAINTDDMLGALGLGSMRYGRRLLAWLVRGAARRFAWQMVYYDYVVGSAGLRAGGAAALPFFVERADVEGAGLLPSTGPLLVVANHPGLYDTIALFAAVPRDDLRVIAAERPFLNALPATSRHLLYVSEDMQARLGLLRSAARHLRGGGALLTFPGGTIEPDPAVLPGAKVALERWSASLELLIRLAPDLAVVPAIVSGVLSARALHHPLTRLRRSEADRQWLAAMLQIIRPRFFRIHMQVAFGSPVYAADYADAAAARAAVLAGASGLIERAEVKRCPRG